MTLTNTNSRGGYCQDCLAYHSWAELDAAIYSDPTVTARNFTPGDLWWGWLCPVTGKELRREPFAFPADMPETQ